MSKVKPDIVTRRDVDDLMNRFYAKALSDRKIGHIFEIAELDLARHLPVIGDFWETLLFGTGDYQRHGRNPLQIHALLSLKTPLRAEHFRRWLEIFNETVDETFTGQRAEFAKMRAAAIANRMSSYVAESGATIDGDC